MTFTHEMEAEGIAVRQYTLQTCFEVIHESFVLPFSNLDDPRYQPTGGPRRGGIHKEGFFIVIEGPAFMDIAPRVEAEGWWCEERDSGDHFFLRRELDEHGYAVFLICDDLNEYAWKVRRYRQRTRGHGGIRSPN